MFLDTRTAPGRFGTPAMLRREQLRDGLLAVADSLPAECPALPDGFLADYLALHWLERRDGALRLTDAAREMCDRLREDAAHPL